MRITYDPRADALAIELRDVPVARTCEVTDTINVDLGKDGRAVVVEILNVRKGLGAEVLQHLGLDLGGAPPSLLIGLSARREAQVMVRVCSWPWG